MQFSLQVRLRDLFTDPLFPKNTLQKSDLQLLKFKRYEVLNTLLKLTIEQRSLVPPVELREESREIAQIKKSHLQKLV